jgi:hypothetical protein
MTGIEMMINAVLKYLKLEPEVVKKQAIEAHNAFLSVKQDFEDLKASMQRTEACCQRIELGIAVLNGAAPPLQDEALWEHCPKLVEFDGSVHENLMRK